MDEALSVDCEAKLDHFVQLRLLLFQLADVQTKRTKLFINHRDNCRVLVGCWIKVLEQLGLGFVADQVPQQLLHLIPLVFLVGIGELLVPLLDCCIVLGKLVASLQDRVDILKQVALFIDDFALLQVVLLDADSVPALLDLLRRQVLVFWVDLPGLELLQELLLTYEVVEQGQLLVDFVYF